MILTPLLSIRVLALAWVIAKRQLVHNRAAQRDAWNQSYDFIVVGAGASGCVVAHRLTENRNTTVLLLEAGGAQDAIWSDIYWSIPMMEQRIPSVHWHYYDEPSTRTAFQFPGERMEQFMGRVIGGSTTHNGEVYNRGNRKLFDEWERRYGAVGWSYKDVMPSFLKFENNTDMRLVNNYRNYHNTNGPVQLTTATNVNSLLRRTQQTLERLGYPSTDFNGPNQTGTMILQRFADTRGFRVTTGSAYLEPNPHPNNLHVVTRAQVLRVLFNGTNAVGVEFNRNDTSFRVYARKEVILSAGTYNTPQLLMLSGIGIKRHLEEHRIPVVMNLPGVGNNLINHPLTTVLIQVNNQSDYGTFPAPTFQNINDRYFNNSGPLLAPQGLGVYLSSALNHEKDIPNLQLNLVIDGNTLAAIAATFRPRSRGTVRLYSSSPYVSPRIDNNYFADPRDFQDVLDALSFVYYIFQAPNLGLSQYVTLPTFESLGCGTCSTSNLYECREGLSCIIRRQTSSFHHPCGTCRMGAVQREDTVVDPQLRVKNMNGLRVCDASVFPDIPNAHIAAASIMTGEKCSQILKDCYMLN